MNRENFKLVVNKIATHPKQWDQTLRHSDCGTKHCFAGWAQILAGKEPRNQSLFREAIIFLGVTSKDGYYLFHRDRTLIDFLEFYNERAQYPRFNHRKHCARGMLFI